MKAGVILALAFGLGGQLPPVAPPPQVPTAPAAPAPASATVPEPAAAAMLAQHRRDQISVMEGVLAAAVSNGARQAIRSLQGPMPGPMLFSSMPRARGFFLDGYGVFFNLEIPTLRPSAVWSMQTMERDMAVAAAALDSLRALADSVPDANAKKTYQAAVRRLEQQVGLPPQQRQGSGQGSGLTNAVSESVAVVEEQDPNEHYTKAVIGACVEAMFEHSKPMDLKADEWLTVALSATEGPLGPGEVTERETIVLRIRGGDLADYLAGRITREEVRKKVDVRMF